MRVGLMQFLNVLFYFQCHRQSSTRYSAGKIHHAFFSCVFLQLLASDGVQQSVPVPVTITVLDANDNTPTFANVSYSVNLFTDITPGEAVIQVYAILELFT